MSTELPGWLSGKESTCQCSRHTYILGLGRPPAEGMATHSSILPGESHGQRRRVGYSPRGLKGSDSTWRLNNNSNAYELSECLYSNRIF